MPRRLQTCRHSPLYSQHLLNPPSPNDGSDSDEFHWSSSEEEEPVEPELPAQEQDAAQQQEAEVEQAEPEPEQAAQEQAEPEQQRPPLWPDQVVAYNSFATWRNEEAFRRVRAGLEDAAAAAEAAAIRAFVETARREEQVRALMDAEQLNANASSDEQHAFIAYREDESASFMAAQRMAHEEFNATRARREVVQAARSDMDNTHRAP